jgi:hypothetical protein
MPSVDGQPALPAPAARINGNNSRVLTLESAPNPLAPSVGE